MPSAADQSWDFPASLKVSFSQKAIQVQFKQCNLGLAFCLCLSPIISHWLVLLNVGHEGFIVSTTSQKNSTVIPPLISHFAEKMATWVIFGKKSYKSVSVVKRWVWNEWRMLYLVGNELYWQCRVLMINRGKAPWAMEVIIMPLIFSPIWLSTIK